MIVSFLLFSAAAMQALAIIVWLLQQISLSRLNRTGMRIPVCAGGGELPALTVFVPARNEARTIEFCISSILAQEYPSLRLIVVDDRSTDQTAAVARRAGGNDARLQVIQVDSLPEGWMGKSHALWTAAQVANTPWLLFVDADCRVLPGGLSSAVRFAERVGADMLSVWPRDGSVGFWERLLIPLCGAMIVIWYGRLPADDGSASVAFANGQFLLMKRDLYRAIGGHESVRTALIEDIPLARLAAARGGRVVSALGAEVCSVRMYSSLGDVFRGWRRIYIGVLTSTQIALCMASIVIGSLAPYLVLAIVGRRWWDGAGGWWQIFGWLSVIQLVALMLTSVRFFSLARCRIRYLWLYPISCIGVLVILAVAWVGRFGSTTLEWRGTKYQVRDSSIRPGRHG